MGKNRGLEEWLDFVVDTLKQLDENVQGAFLQQFLLRLVSLEASEKESIRHWEGVLARQSQLAEKLGRPVTLRTAAVDYFGELSILRSPILMEYAELTKLRHNAATDPLTGLNNRRIFDEHLHREINRSTRYRSSFALLSVDLRKFKSVNDTYGHAAGDEILRSVARAALETLRGSDMPCRTGGDEFAILLPQTDRSSAEVLAERIARKFEEYANSLVPNSPVAIDYGIAIFPEDGHDAATLFTWADKSLYARKQKAHGQSPSQESPPKETDREIGALASKSGREAISGDKAQVQVLSTADDAIAAKVETSLTDRGPLGRKNERIRIEGTPALGIVRVGGRTSTVKVLDMSNGGVCLLVDQVELPESFPARLQVPWAPEGDLTLHRVYSRPLPEGKQRVGCSFTPLPPRLAV